MILRTSNTIREIDAYWMDEKTEKPYSPLRELAVAAATKP
jgi:hypothetical protein